MNDIEELMISFNEKQKNEVKGFLILLHSGDEIKNIFDHGCDSDVLGNFLIWYIKRSKFTCSQRAITKITNHMKTLDRLREIFRHDYEKDIEKQESRTDYRENEIRETDSIPPIDPTNYDLQDMYAKTPMRAQISIALLEDKLFRDSVLLVSKDN